MAFKGFLSKVATYCVRFAHFFMNIDWLGRAVF